MLKEIKELLREHGKLSLKELAGHFAVAPKMRLL